MAVSLSYHSTSKFWLCDNHPSQEDLDCSNGWTKEYVHMYIMAYLPHKFRWLLIPRSWSFYLSPQWLLTLTFESLQSRHKFASFMLLVGSPIWITRPGILRWRNLLFTWQCSFIHSLPKTIFWHRIRHICKASFKILKSNLSEAFNDVIYVLIEQIAIFMQFWDFYEMDGKNKQGLVYVRPPSFDRKINPNKCILPCNTNTFPGSYHACVQQIIIKD